MSEIKVGNYYANDNKEDGNNETCIMLILPRKGTLPTNMYTTETLALHCDMSMWQNDWLEEYVQREATQEEIEIFKQERKKYGKTLQGFGQMVTGMKLETFDDTVKALLEIMGR